MPLAEARRRSIASSHLYFRSDGAALQVHYGVQDRPVPVRNAEALERRLNRAGSSEEEFFYYPDAGHDQSQTAAPERARRFLLQRLTTEKGQEAPKENK